jgi:hypothetical protein
VSTPFEPLHPAPRRRLIAAFVAGPVLWLVAIVVALLVIDRSDAVELGLLITLASFVVATSGLLALYALRRRQESRAHRG